MKFFCVVLSLISMTIAEQLAPIVAPISSQYHAQDNLGQYSYGYANSLSAKNEFRSVDGSTLGGYSYIDAEGKLQRVDYVADDVHGFRVRATNLPVAPVVHATSMLPVPVLSTPASIPTLMPSTVSAKTSSPIELRSSSPIFASPLIHGYSYTINPIYGLTSFITPSGITPYTAHFFAGPIVPIDTPEVAKARAEHLAEYERVKKSRE